MLELAAVERAELSRLSTAPSTSAATWTGCSSFDLAAGRAARSLRTAVCAEWLGDLRLLGMRPMVGRGERLALEERG